MLAADRLHCARGGRTVLSEVSLALAAGEVLGVLGANGAGKTSLLATLAGELRSAGGSASHCAATALPSSASRSACAAQRAGTASTSAAGSACCWRSAPSRP